MTENNCLISNSSPLGGDSSSLGEDEEIREVQETGLRSDGLESQESSSGAEANKEPEAVLPVTQHKKSGTPKQNWVISNGATGPEGGTMTIKLKLDGLGKKKKRGPKRKKEVKFESVDEKKAKKPKKEKSVKQAKNSKNNHVKDAEIADQNIDDDSSKPKVKGTTTIGWGSSMPEEVLVKIFEESMKSGGKSFQFLSRMSNVCRLWQRAASSQCLWNRVDLSLIKRPNEKMLLELCKKNFMSRTSELSLAGWDKKLSVGGIRAISQQCSMLTAINLSRCCRITSNCIQTLADSCPLLRQIDLSGITQSNSLTSPLSFSCLKYFFNKCGSQLTHLILAENLIINFSTVIKAIGEQCPNLEVLDLSNLRTMSDRYLPLEMLQKGCPKLRVLRLANTPFGVTSIPLALQAQSPGFPELEELSVAAVSGFGNHLGDAELERLLKTSEKLKLLDVRGCRGVNVSGLVKVPAWDLEHLHLSKCDATNNPDLELVLKKWCHSLVEVDLSWSNNSLSINQAVLALTATDGESKLKTVDVGGSAIEFSAIKKLLEKCPQLQMLNLQSCRGLPRGIKRLYRDGEELETLRSQMSDSKFQEAFEGTDD